LECYGKSEAAMHDIAGEKHKQYKRSATIVQEEPETHENRRDLAVS